VRNYRMKLIKNQGAWQFYLNPFVYSKYVVPRDRILISRAHEYCKEKPGYLFETA